MADQELPTFNIGEFLAKLTLELFKPENAGKLSKVLQNAGEEQLKTLVGGVLNLAGPIALSIGRGIIEGEELAQGVMDQLAALGIEDLLGVKVNQVGLARRGGASGRKPLGNAIGSAILEHVTGTRGALEPGTAAGEKFLGTMASFAIEGWLEGFMVEFLTSLIPAVGNIETFAELDDIMANVMGFGRISRRVLSPLVDATTVTPMRWHVNKTYRPELLSAGEVARQVTRGRWTLEQGKEELARQGYSDQRIEALFNAARKFFAAGDVRQFVTRGEWTETAGLQHLRDQGYEPDAAQDALRLEGLRRIEQLENQEAGALVSAYADRRIDRVTFTGLLGDAVTVASERALLTELAELRRAVNVKGLSPAEARACVKAGILSVRDYRLALEQDGYDDGAVLALELLLRHELDERSDAEQLRAAALAERATEQAARDEASAKRKAEIEAERALTRRGAESDLERAVVRGLIAFSRLEEVYAARYDADTVAVLLELVEDDRLAYLAQQEARDGALQRGARRNLSAGDVTQAFMTNLLTRDELRRRLEQIGFDAGDAELLAATAATRKAEIDAAKEQRKEAEARAKKRAIDLGRFERLVRRGARSLAQYDALLAELGFDDAARAGMAELLELTIADDARAREERAAGEARVQSRGVSLEQFRRGVLLGVKTVSDFEQFLIREGFTTDAQIVLLADVRSALADAEAAQRRRDEEAARVEARELPIGTVVRAARLGVISPDAYVARLQRDGFSDEDVELQLELLLVEIADVQAARARRDAAEGDAQARGLSLADVARAVTAGVRSIEDYRARAAGLGYSVDAVDDLVALLQMELAQLADARARRGAIVGELAARNLSISQLEEAVTKGFKSLDVFIADVEALGYGADDAELLAGLLAVDLEAKAAG